MLRVLAVALSTIAITHPATASKKKTSCAQRPERAVRACIWQGARRWHVPYPILLRRARCESHLNPYAKNASGATSLFQFMYSTWLTTPYRSHWIYSARYQSLAAAWMHRVGRGGEWVCR